MLAYHFTSRLHIPKIIASGVLRRTESNASGSVPHAGPDVVWLLDTPDLGNYSHGLNEAAMRQGLGLGAVPAGRPDKTEYRFTVEASDRWTKRWVDWAPLNVEPDWADIMVRLAGGWEAAEHWLISFAPIPHTRWMALENVHTGEAVPLTVKEVAAR
jgi:hypothetical protein